MTAARFVLPLVLVASMAASTATGWLVGAAVLLAATAGPRSGAAARAALLLGILVPTAAVSGPGSLLLGAAVLLVAARPGNCSEGLGPFREFLGLTAAWLGFRFLFSLDLEALRSVHRAIASEPGGVSVLFSLPRALSLWWRFQPPPISEHFISLVRFTVLLLLSGLARRDRMVSAALLRGMTWGLTASAAVLVLELAIPDSITLPNELEYWSGQGRYSGLFSDPNSLGVFAALFVPFLVERVSVTRRVGPAVTLALVSGAALASGSRSFVLGMGVLVTLQVWKRRVGGVPAPAVFAVVLGTVLAVIQFIPPDSIRAMPDSLERIFASLRADSIGNALFSRSVFFRVALRSWFEHPLLGIGPGAFRLSFPEYAGELGIPTGAWSDNPNSWYLGILAELGVAGLLAAALAGSRFRLSTEPTASHALVVLLVLLAVGPHLEFDEVSILSAIVLGLGATVIPSDRRWSLVPAVLLLPILVGIGLRAATDRYGLYPWEEAEGTMFRWTSRTARAPVTCTAAGELTVEVRSHLPGQAVAVSGMPDGGATRLEPGRWTRLAVPCPLPGRSYPVELVVSPAWMPLARGQGDPRLLGVQLRVP